ncbi:hypothetical protein [Methylosinus sp. PW1]|uniref:hypothetical protein n=1 Tax=Methylosinus sp. PW1 TaxID=107636 RepID=UPI000560BDCF|nr:hypothetical protein [Methylosinus sp. PW1]
MLENANNRYEWSSDGQLTKRTPKNGGVAWSFVSSFRARTNQMRLDAAFGSDGTTIGVSTAATNGSNRAQGAPSPMQ